VNFGFDWTQALADSAVSNGLLIIACWLISIIFQFYLPQKERRWNVLFIILGLSFLVLFGQKGFLILFYSQDHEFVQFLSKSLTIRFCFIFLLICCMTILSMLLYTSEEEHENRQRKIDTEKLAKDAELYKLRQQLQPHFLFNSLNSISALAGSRPDEARKMIQQLSDFLRGTLRKEDQQWVTLGEELQYLQLYLDIEKVRFGYRLSTVIHAEEKARDMRLPPMLIQPIVENAIKFGLYDTTQEVTISIIAKVNNQSLEITVQNPFDPETSIPNKGTGFGLNSIKRRLYLLYARNDLLETRSENNIFNTIVTIPQGI
jgi:LytS/YehU family sensor histidine kinase